MGLIEGKEIHLSIIDELDDNPDGMCLPLAIIESLPEGYPPKELWGEFRTKIIALLARKVDGEVEEFWTRVTQFFWPNKIVSDLHFLSADDPEMLGILNYVYDHGLPVIAGIPRHAIGLRLVMTETSGVIAEFVYGLQGQRPFIPLDGSNVHDEESFLENKFFNAGGYFVVFPPVEAMAR